MNAIICDTRDCNKPARVSIKTNRKNDGSMSTSIWWDEREGPKTASRYCKKDGSEVLTSLAIVLIDEG